MHVQLLSTLLFSGLAVAGPLACRQAAAPTPTPTPAAGNGGTTSSSGVDLAKAIAAVMPSANSCSGADFPDECRTAEQAAPFISKACADLSDGECAATVALMGLESGDLKFKHNVSPGRPGQGTANMMQIDVSSINTRSNRKREKFRGRRKSRSKLTLQHSSSPSTPRICLAPARCPARPPTPFWPSSPRTPPTLARPPGSSQHNAPMCVMASRLAPTKGGSPTTSALASRGLRGTAWRTGRGRSRRSTSRGFSYRYVISTFEEILVGWWVEGRPPALVCSFFLVEFS